MAKTIGSFDLASLKYLRDDVTQYFWFESDSSSAWGSGAHVTLYPESQFTDSTSPNYMKGQNIIMNTDGFSIRNGGLPMMVLDNDSLDFNAVDTTQETYTTMATFGLTGATIGQSGNAHSVIDANGQRFYASNGTTQLANIGYGEGQGEIGTSVAPYYSMGIRGNENDDYIHDYVGTYSTSKTYNVGDLVLYNSSVYICTIKIDTPEPWTSSHWRIPIGNYSNSEGMYTISAGYASHAEGGDTTVALGMYSHAEGEHTYALGDCSHAEGMDGIAQGDCSHVEGMDCIAHGEGSHAEGYDTKANEYYSHASGWGTIAVGVAQTTIGKYNIQDPDVRTSKEKAFIIGNGSSLEPSNALTVDWNGQVQCQGVGSLNGTYNEIYLGDYTNRAVQINPSLTTSSGDNLWLTAVLKAICADYPNKQFVVFKGRLAPNSQGYFKIMIYDTGNVSSGMPQYAYGTWNKWQNTFWLISTNAYAFSYVAK